MKKIFLPFLILICFLSSCSKVADDGVDSFAMTGPSTVSLIKGSHNGDERPEIELLLTTKGSQHDYVTFSLENVPAGLSYVIDTSSGIPPFKTSVRFIDSGVVEGNYTLNMVVTDYSSRITFPLNVVVTSLPDCTSDVTGSSYVTVSPCRSTGNFVQNVTRAEGGYNRVFFSNIDNTGAKIYADIDCEHNTLSIPEQTFNEIVYSGTGAYSVANGQHIITLSVTQYSARYGVSSCEYRLTN